MAGAGARYTVTQAAVLLGVSDSTLRGWDRDGVVSAAKRDGLGRRYYTEADLEKLRTFIAKRTPAAP